MTAENTSSLWGYGTTKTFKIPIDHLDFKFIEKCSDVKHLEKILRILRSGEEGHYPELTDCCEKRIESLAPESRALRKEKPAATASSFTAEEWEEISGDMKSWVTEIKKDEESQIQHPKTGAFQELSDNLPPVRCLQIIDEDRDLKRKPTKTKKKVPRDYKEWDKFDVEKECLKIDEEYKEETNKPNTRPHLLKIEKKIDTTGLTNKEKDFLATREKEKGNEAFSSGDYEEAFTYYTRSISAFPTVNAYNNRAQAAIKLQNWNSVFQDCEKVLDLEPENLKALMRRATAYKHQKKYHAAKEDLKKVLQVEPDNEIAKKILSEVEKELKDSEPASGIQTKGKRMVIQEVEDSDDENGRENGEKHENDRGAGRPSSPAGGARGREARAGPSPRGRRGGMGSAHRKAGRPAARQGQQGHQGDPGGHGDQGGGEARPAAGPRSQGNHLFRSGQFGAAALIYGRDIERAEAAGTESADELSILYSNRAACYLKEGNCSGCIQDCNRALELHPFSVKPLLRRAVAYESTEQFRQAYVDYKTLLQLDSGIQAANDGVNRITRTLIELDGPTWREKLPAIPVVPLAAHLPSLGGRCSNAENVPHKVTQPGKQQQAKITDETPEETFRKLKEKGNEFVKNGKYNEAVSKYQECLKINPGEGVIYTNRALCYLKLGKFEEAKQDCDQVLQLESSNIKAFYRRALAYKGLEDYQASLNDLSKVLLIDPNISEAKKELEEITQFLQMKNNTSVPGREKERKKIIIQEVTEGNEEESKTRRSEGVSVDCLMAEERTEANRPARVVEKPQFSKPSNAYEFGQAISAMNARKDEESCAHLFSLIEPEDLPMLLTNKLEGDTFLLIIQALKNHLLDNNPTLVYQHLLYLSKAERFKMVLVLLREHEKQQVELLFDLLPNKLSNQFPLEDLQNLKNDYEL
ncbi:sperm-associated antigen 1 isoform X1 [Ornithorhynchus anatinus]|uniref:Sperm-associated antigen 1 n=1 Tax=Ornithorhynchus anatinus TaxID=9258 RepID=F6Y4H5_ORNAN|nr:sperm-associated antigen 1 isoform X1 [Ornithorhynchus anatinus]XP_028919267.1 sperm-associated antigen 1 isoform X1 [Ornithorhynchus anatinus]